jgi:hypothetical protein
MVVLKSQPYRLIRDSLGFYSQVPIEIPDVEVAHDRIVPVADVEELPAKRRSGRPKKSLNSEFEVDLP